MKGHTYAQARQKIILFTFVILAAGLMTQASWAQEVRVSQKMAAHHALKVDAVETYYGEVISTEEIENFQDSAELFSRDVVRTSRGELNARDIEYVLINARPPSGNYRGGIGDIARPPHN